MNTDKLDMEDNAVAGSSPLYPPETYRTQQDSCRELNCDAIHDLGIEHMIAAFTDDREIEKKFGGSSANYLWIQR